jgi:hypothetical protein
VTCPWSGQPCECAAFPYTKNGVIPQYCEDRMPDEILGVRKVSPAGKARFKAYRAELEKNMR